MKLVGNNDSHMPPKDIPSRGWSARYYPYPGIQLLKSIGEEL